MGGRGNEGLGKDALLPKPVSSPDDAESATERELVAAQQDVVAPASEPRLEHEREG
jgi:hypothetical protein